MSPPPICVKTTVLTATIPSAIARPTRSRRGGGFQTREACIGIAPLPMCRRGGGDIPTRKSLPDGFMSSSDRRFSGADPYLILRSEIGADPTDHRFAHFRKRVALHAARLARGAGV